VAVRLKANSSFGLKSVGTFAPSCSKDEGEGEDEVGVGVELSRREDHDCEDR
jgi:hypothetical protein